jgi:hypothetical protein
MARSGREAKPLPIKDKKVSRRKPWSHVGQRAIIRLRRVLMTLARLLPAALVLCSLPVFAQNRQSRMARPSTPPCRESSVTGCPVVGSVLNDRPFSLDLNSATAATLEKPWKIVPNQPADGTAAKDPLNRLQIDKFKVFRAKTESRTLLVGPEADAGMFLTGMEGRDGTCYAIRSYVVARDSKDSDSTHPVSYSTCQPAKRYSLRTTDMRSGSVDR